MFPSHMLGVENASPILFACFECFLPTFTLVCRTKAGFSASNGVSMHMRGTHFIGVTSPVYLYDNQRVISVLRLLRSVCIKAAF